MKREGVKHVAHQVVELARSRVDELLTPGVMLGGESLRRALMNVYLQGLIDGASVEQLRAKSRGHYKPRGARKVA